MSRYDSDDLRRVSPHLRAGLGVSRTRPFPVGGLRRLAGPAEAARVTAGRARRGPAAGDHGAALMVPEPGERPRLRPPRGWHYLYMPVADQAALPAGPTAGCSRLPARCCPARSRPAMTTRRRPPWPGWRTAEHGRLACTSWPARGPCPLAWFVPFSAAERWLALGPGRRTARPLARQTASVTRALALHHRDVPGAPAGGPGPGRAAGRPGALRRRRLGAAAGRGRAGQGRAVARGVPPVLAGGARLRRAGAPAQRRRPLQ